MKTLSKVLPLLCLLCLPAVAPAQRVSDMTETFVIQSNWLFMVTVPGVTNYKAKFATLVEEMQGSLNITSEVTEVEFLAFSNAIVSLETTRNAAVSNGVISAETTRNAAVSNALVSLISSSSGGIATNIGVGGTIFQDAALGNDATAQRTNMARPFLSASNAVNALLSGYTIEARGGTNLVPPKLSSGSGNNANGALAITNKSNFRITGQPGAVWQMASRTTNYGVSSSSMMVLVGCTNVLIDNMTFVGLLTNGLAGQDFAICLINCGYVTIDHCLFENWNDQGITDDSSGVCRNRYITIKDSIFRRIGTTSNDVNIVDGTAISVNASDLFIRGNLFQYNIRDWEIYSQGATAPIVSNLWFTGNTVDQTRQKSVFFVNGPGASDVHILNNRFRGYATNALGSPTIASAIHIYSVSNMVAQGNYFAGYDVAIQYGYGGTVANSAFVDVDISGNIFEDLTVYGVYALRDRSAAAKLDRVSIKNNKFKTILFSAVALNANNGIVQDNEMIDCAGNNDVSSDRAGVIMIGHINAPSTTNSTNITITGNKIYQRDFLASGATGIVMTAGSVSNIVWGNDVDKGYAGVLHDSGSNTLTMPLNKVATTNLLRSDINGRLATVTIGTNIIWDGTTLAASGTGGGGGDVTTAQLNTASNAVVTSSRASDIITSNGVVALIGGGGGGTNYPPIVATGTNITVGTGVRKSLTMRTNISTAVSFNGTEILGEVVTLVVTNTSAVASNITVSFFQDAVASSYFDATVASNVTGFMVVSNSSKTLMFVYNGSAWRLESTLGKEMELYVAGGLVMTTNSGTSIVTLSNSLSLNQLNNVTIGTPANNDVLLWNSTLSKWINSLSPGGDIVSNITVSTTNNILLDFGAANVFKLTLLTNWSETFTNVTTLTKRGYVYYQQDTNGGRILNRYAVAGGLLQTNATQNMQPTTNANALDLLELMPGFFTTNLMAWWPQDFQPRIRFTNSLFAFASFLDNFNRSNADPMSTAASDGHTWTSGPGSMGEPRIISSMLFGNAGTTGARVLTPTIGGNQKASLTLIGNTGHLGPMVRMQSTVDDSGYILVSTDATHLTIYRLDDTALTVLFTSSATPTISNGDTITLSINGTGGSALLECFLNGVSYGTVADATYSGGQPGVWLDSDTASGGPFSAIEQ